MRDLLMARAGLRGFLMDCRSDLTPEDVGLVPGRDPRRVPGLRRDEVARLVGVDTEYYADFERGQVTGPVPSWLEDAVAEALLLDDVDRGELARLIRNVYTVIEEEVPPADQVADLPVIAAGTPMPRPYSAPASPAPAPTPPSSVPGSLAREAGTWLADGEPPPWHQVTGPASGPGPAPRPPVTPGFTSPPPDDRSRGTDPALTALLNTFDMPAILRSRTLDVLAANRAGQLLYAPVLGWEGRAGKHTNLLEFALLAGDEARHLWPDWDAVVEQAVAALRAAAEANPRDPDVIGVVGALSTASRTFGRLWAAPEGAGGRYTDAGIETVCHPLLGTVTLPYRVLTVDDAGSQVAVYAPERGTTEHQALRRLVEWARAG